MDVVDVAQAKQAGEQAATEHAHCQVESDGQALPDDAAAMTRSDDITVEKTKQKQKKTTTIFNNTNTP